MNEVEYLLSQMSTLKAVTAKRKKRKLSPKIRKRVLSKWTWDSNEINTPELKKMNNDKIFIGASDFTDYIIGQMHDARAKKLQSTHHRDIKLISTPDVWIHYLEVEFDGDHIIETSPNSGLVIFDEFNFIRYNTNSNSTELDIYGDLDFIDDIKELVLKTFKEVISYIEWMYSADGSAVNVPLNTDRLPVDEMYPFLEGEKLTDYYERFMQSSANILLLIGPPGTGKTTFIRGLLAHTESSAVVTYDAAILEKDYVFARFVEDETNIMVLEDSDTFLKARSDGNTMMHRFLNVGDGLVTTKGKKLIFSTNLPSVRDIDPALVRPGRCFDIVHFDQLKLAEAKKLADKLGVKLPVRARGHEMEKYSIAEIFNEKQIDVPKNTGTKFGFI